MSFIFLFLPLSRYRHFLVLLVTSLSAADHLEWCGFVESKVRYLVSNLERNQYISLAHVNPRCFERATAQQPPTANAADKSIDDSSATEAATTFCSMWFIGLEFRKMDNLNVDLTENIQNFTNLVHKHTSSISFHKPGMDFEVRHVRRKQLNTYLDKDILNVERKKRDVNAASTAARDERKRAATASDTNQTAPEENEEAVPSKRQKVKENLLKIFIFFEANRNEPMLIDFSCDSPRILFRLTKWKTKIANKIRCENERWPKIMMKCSGSSDCSLWQCNHHQNRGLLSTRELSISFRVNGDGD